jgi:hypothetical protein
MQELELEDPAAFKNFVRVDADMFNELLDCVPPRIYKTLTWMRRYISRVEVGNHPKIPCHWGQLQEPDVWVQSSIKHHL